MNVARPKLKQSASMIGKCARRLDRINAMISIPDQAGDYVGCVGHDVFPSHANPLRDISRVFWPYSAKVAEMLERKLTDSKITGQIFSASPTCFPKCFPVPVLFKTVIFLFPTLKLRSFPRCVGLSFSHSGEPSGGSVR